MSYKSRVVKMEIDGQQFFGLEIPQQAFEELGLRDGEILETVVVAGESLSLKKTGVIVNDDSRGN